MTAWARHRLDVADRPGRGRLPARPPGWGAGGRHPRGLDQALAGYYGDASFATGIIARLATSPGRLEWSCAGHPRPLLLRGRKVVAELSCDATLPFGLGDGTPVPAICELEPDDAVLLYTDGVVEARTPDGELFGLDRLADLLEREDASGQSAEELLRRLGWCGPCWSISPAACAMTPRCCRSSGPATKPTGSRADPAGSAQPGCLAAQGDPCPHRAPDAGATRAAPRRSWRSPARYSRRTGESRPSHEAQTIPSGPAGPGPGCMGRACG